MSDIYETAYKAADAFLDFRSRDFSDSELREGIKRAVDAALSSREPSDELIQWISGLALGVYTRFQAEGRTDPIGDEVVRLVRGRDAQHTGDA